MNRSPGKVPTKKSQAGNQTEKPPRNSVNIVQIAFWVSLISGLTAISAYVSGIDSIPEMISLAFGDEATPTFTPILPTPTVEGPLEPLIRGTATLPIGFSKTFQLGYNFRLAQIASSDIPADLIISECRTPGTSQYLYCDLAGTNISTQGNTNLDEILGVDPETYKYLGDFLNSRHLRVGHAYLIQAYNGHLVKFRILNIEIFFEGAQAVSAQLFIEYVYQTNDRYDFHGP